MSELFDQYDVPKIEGNQITIPDHFPAIYVSEDDEVYCFVGVLLDGENRHSIDLHAQPYYMRGMHSTAKKLGAKIKGFFRIAAGCIYLDNYVDNQYDAHKEYKLIEASIQYPTAASTYYGVRGHEELTRKIFGLTCAELESVLEAYAKALGTYTPYIQYPRLTRSVRAQNYCDLTNLWIPKQFPYITFEESGFDFSHMSLWGFYRHLQLMLKTAQFDFAKALRSAGADEAVLQALLKIDYYPYHCLPTVTKDVLQICGRD